MAERASEKGLPPGIPVSQYHARCCPPGPRSASPPPAAPDLRDSVAVRESGGRRLEYVAKWDGEPRRLPDLPADVLKRVLFPKAFPSRIESPRHFGPRGIEGVRHRRSPPDRTAAPWTEVAMHLAEALEPGRY